MIIANLQVRELQDQCQANSDAADEWKAKYEDLEYKLQQSTSQLAILDHRLYDAQQSKKFLEEELAAFKGTSGSPGGEFWLLSCLILILYPLCVMENRCSKGKHVKTNASIFFWNLTIHKFDGWFRYLQLSQCF